LAGLPLRRVVLDIVFRYDVDARIDDSGRRFSLLDVLQHADTFVSPSPQFLTEEHLHITLADVVQLLGERINGYDGELAGLLGRERPRRRCEEGPCAGKNPAGDIGMGLHGGFHDADAFINIIIAILSRDDTDFGVRLQSFEYALPPLLEVWGAGSPHQNSNASLRAHSLNEQIGHVLADGKIRRSVVGKPLALR